MFSDRLALGLLAGILVWRTGGLEAAIAAHVVSNVYTYLNGALVSSVAAVRATQEISWFDAMSDVGVVAVFTVAALVVARRQGLSRRVNLTGGLAVSSDRRTPQPRADALDRPER